MNTKTITINGTIRAGRDGAACIFKPCVGTQR